MFDLGIVSIGRNHIRSSDGILFRCGCERQYQHAWAAQRENPTQLSLCFDHTKLYERYLCDLAGIETRPEGWLPPTRPHRHTAMDR